MSAAAAAPAEVASPTSGHGKRKLHVKPKSHIDELAKIQEARTAAKKVLKELRAKQKAESKKHKRLMSKASRLEIDDLRQIAEMKQAGPISGAQMTPSSCSTGSASASSVRAATTPSGEDASEDVP
jgi:hypothetical protein